MGDNFCRVSGAVSRRASDQVATLTRYASVAFRGGGHLKPATFPVASDTPEQGNHMLPRRVNAPVIPQINQMRKLALPAKKVSLPGHLSELLQVVCSPTSGSQLPLRSTSGSVAGLVYP